MEGETKENVLTLPYGQHPNSQVNFGGFWSFRQSSPHQIGETKIASKVWLTYTLCYIQGRRRPGGQGKLAPPNFLSANVFLLLAILKKP